MNYFDLLTVPLLCVCIPILFEQLMKEKLSPKERLIDAISKILLFLLGWALMWISKFVLYYLVIDKSSIHGIITQIKHRLSMQTDWKLNESFQFFHLFVRGMILILLVLIFIMVKKKYNNLNTNNAKRYFWLIAYAFIPMPLLLVMYNHIITHSHMFTYRNFIITFLCLNIYLYKFLIPERSNKGDKK